MHRINQLPHVALKHRPVRHQEWPTVKYKGNALLSNPSPTKHSNNAHAMHLRFKSCSKLNRIKHYFFSVSQQNTIRQTKDQTILSTKT